MPRIHVALGVAPKNAESFTEEVARAIEETATNKYVSSIGSCGLDDPFDEMQILALKRQISLAKQLDLALVVESAGAYDELLDVLRENEALPERVLLRAFDGSAEQLGRWAQWGSYVSFDARAADDPVRFCELARMVPPDRILVESGAPARTIARLKGHPARTDQAVFVADVLMGVVPPSRIGCNAQILFRC